MAKKIAKFVCFCSVLLGLVILAGRLFLGEHGYFKQDRRPFIGEMTSDLSVEAEALALKDGLNQAFFGEVSPYLLEVHGFDGAFSTPLKGDKSRTILWLGAFAQFSTFRLSEYRLVFTTSKLLCAQLEALGIKAFYLPEFAAHTVKRSKPKFVAVIGNPPFIEEILQKQRIAYKKYDLNAADAIRQDMPHFKAILVSRTRLNANSFDIHPLFLEAAAAQIPLITYFSWPSYEDTLNMFNDSISFYEHKNDAERLILSLDDAHSEVFRRAAEAQALVFREYSLKNAVKRVREAFENKKEPNEEAEAGSLNFDLPTAVGHYGAGDYWLARDLCAFMQKDGLSCRLSFFNSLYKYSAETNILVRGFLSYNAGDLKGKTNILYIAYPQFAQNENGEHILPLDEYAKKVFEQREGIDAVATASKKLAYALKALGMKAYYVPQFTNHKRFYPEYDETYKSEVFFVGVKAFYREAAPILLKHGLPVTIYGPLWGEDAKGNFVDNRELYKHYAAAKIVLNDTRAGMKAYGVISNRIFDATAAGALVISDYMPEIEEIYGDSVVMYKTEEELVRLVKYYLDPANEAKRLEKAKRAREITLKNFTAEKAAARFDEIIKEITK